MDKESWQVWQAEIFFEKKKCYPLFQFRSSLFLKFQIKFSL